MSPLRTLLSIACVLVMTCAALAAALAADTVTASYAQIMQGLKEKQNEELFEFLKRFPHQLDKSHLNDPQVDAIVERLKVIKTRDAWTKKAAFKGGKPRDVTPNRGAAKRAILYVEFARISNRLSKRPMKQRVAGIIDYINNPPIIEGYDTSNLFQGELVRIGPEGVPFMVQHNPAEHGARGQIVVALRYIGDPGAIDYLIEEAKKSNNFWQHRTKAIEGLAQFKEDRVVVALIELMNDKTTFQMEMHMQQLAAPVRADRSRLATFRPLPWSAALALTEITGKDFGPLYNEDHSTWKAWYNAKDKNSFESVEVKRSDDQIKMLIENLVDRYMSKRPSPWETSNALNKQYHSRLDTQADTPKPYDVMIRDLKALGPGIVPILVTNYDARVKEQPNWRPMARWVRTVLTDLKWPEAIDAASELDISGPHVDLESW